jgi:hypothetical protein
VKTLGARGELIVAQELMQRDWNVAFPFGDNCHYDLIAEKSHHFCRIQIKCTEKVALTVQHHGPHYAFTLSHGSITKEAYTKEHIDFFICCVIDGNRFWIVPVDLVATKTLKIFRDGKKYHEYEGAWDLLR